MTYATLLAFMSSGWFWILLVWSVIWKGISLWKSARNKHMTWFVILFITSTIGILPIIYLLINGRKARVVHHEAKKTTRKRIHKKARRRKK